MGHAQNHKYYKSKSGFFIVKIQEAFQYRPDWYREGEVRDMVLQYYYVLRSVLREHPELRRCLTRCKECGIFFLTHPRNAGRRDLKCSFGCQQIHRQKSSTQRSIEYYRTEEGKAKKKALNGKRGRVGQSCHVEIESSHERLSNNEVEIIHDDITIGYLQMVIGLIEGRHIGREEILAMLAKILRQHSIGKGKKFKYAFKYPGGNGP